MQNTTGKCVLFEGKQPETILISMVISSYISLASFTYTLRKHLSDKFFKENVICFLTSLCSLVCSTYNLIACYAYVNEANIMTCPLFMVLYSTVVTASRCFSNLVFACRYKTINQNNRVLAEKRAYAFTVSIVVVSVVHLVFTYLYAGFVPLNNCRQGTVKGARGYLYFSIACYMLITFLQTVILVEIIKPVFKHCMHLNTTTISSKYAIFFLNRINV